MSTGVCFLKVIQLGFSFNGSALIKKLFFWISDFSLHAFRAMA